VHVVTCCFLREMAPNELQKSYRKYQVYLDGLLKAWCVS